MILDLDTVAHSRDARVFVCLRVNQRLYVHVICVSSTLCVQAVCLAVANIYSPPRLDVIREQRWQVVLMSSRILCCLLMSGVECKWGFQEEAVCPLWEMLHEGSLFEMRTVDVIAVMLLFNWAPARWPALAYVIPQHEGLHFVSKCVKEVGFTYSKLILMRCFFDCTLGWTVGWIWRLFVIFHHQLSFFKAIFVAVAQAGQPSQKEATKRSVKLKIH